MVYGDRPPIKSAFYVTSPATARIVRIHALMTDHSPIQVAMFHEVDEAAKWLEISREILDRDIRSWHAFLWHRTHVGSPYRQWSVGRCTVSLVTPTRKRRLIVPLRTGIRMTLQREIGRLLARTRHHLLRRQRGSALLEFERCRTVEPRHARKKRRESSKARRDRSKATGRRCEHE